MTTYDFDLHGIVGIRLLDASERDAATVTRQLGPLRAQLHRDPDITIRFVDHLTSGPLTYVGLGDTGFDDRAFYVLRSQGGSARTMLPFQDVGAGLELLCERAAPAVPHLIALVNLTALSRDVLPMHASAFATDSLDVLVTGWAKGGKTETLLGCVHDGASYIGDEWVYLTREGKLLGLPEPIRLWDWQLRQWGALLASRPRPDRVRLATWRAVVAATAAVGGTSLPGAGLARKGAPVLARQGYLQVSPAQLFGADRIAPRGQLGAVVLVMSHEAPHLTVGSAGLTEVADRMRASLEDERAPFMAHYRQFRYAFPQRSSALVDTAAEREARLLSGLFDGRPAAKVLHPHPCDIVELGRAVLSAAHGTLAARSDAGAERVS